MQVEEAPEEGADSVGAAEREQPQELASDVACHGSGEREPGEGPEVVFGVKSPPEPVEDDEEEGGIEDVEDVGRVRARFRGTWSGETRTGLPRGPRSLEKRLETG